MGRHKGMAGRAYKVSYYSNNEATVTYTYLCPYCNQVSTVQKDYSTGLDIIEKGIFYEPLSCEHCGKITDVRFLPHNRI